MKKTAFLILVSFGLAGCGSTESPKEQNDPVYSGRGIIYDRGGLDRPSNRPPGTNSPAPTPAAAPNQGH